jgi:O-antigen ligase
MKLRSMPAKLLMGLGAVIPLVFCPSLQDSFDLSKLAVAGLVLVVAGLIWLWSSPPRVYFVHGLEIPITFFFLVTLASTLVSVEPMTSVWGIYRVYTFGLVPIATMLLLFQLSTQIPLARWTSALITACLISIVLVGIYAILQYTGHEILERMPVVAGGRVWVTLGNPVYVGALFAMAIPLALYEGLLQPSAAKRALAWAALVLAMTGILISLTRGAWVGALAGSLWMVCRLPSKRRKSAGWAVGSLLVALILVGLVNPVMRARAKSILSAQEGSNAARIEGWKGALRVARKYPWLGSGPDTFIRSFRGFRSHRYLHFAGFSVTQAHAHNDVFQFAATGGMLGVLAYFALAIALIRRAWRGHPGLAGGIVALAVQNQFNFSSLSTSVWLVLWAAALPGPSDEDRILSLSWFPAWFRLALSGLVLALGGALGRLVWADAVFQDGKQAAVNQQPLRALEAYQKAWRLHPVELYQNDLSNTVNALAQGLPEGNSRRQLLGEAWDSVRVLTSLQPANPDAWNNRGVAAMWLTQMARQDHRADARQAFEEAVRLDPVFVDAWANLAKWEHLNGNLEGEKSNWRKVLELDPSHAMARQVLQGAR